MAPALDLLALLSGTYFSYLQAKRVVHKWLDEATENKATPLKFRASVMFINRVGTEAHFETKRFALSESSTRLMVLSQELSWALHLSLYAENT